LVEYFHFDQSNYNNYAYRCDETTRQVYWEGIMKTIGVDKAHHKTGTSTVNYNTVEQEKKYERLRQEGEELNFLKEFKQAHEKANTALKGMTEIYGENALQVVPFYLLVIEIALQEKNLKKAEEMLSLINWILVKDKKTIGPNCSTENSNANTTNSIPDEVKDMYGIRMNKLYCLLLLEYKAFQEALQRGARGAYHCSLLFGPEHLYTSELYFSIGRALQRQALTESVEETKDNEGEHLKDAALGMFDKVVDIWYRFLTDQPENTSTYMLEHQRLRLFEGTRMLQLIADARVQALGIAHVATGEVLYTQVSYISFQIYSALDRNTVVYSL
jgi:hypothetical protein